MNSSLKVKTEFRFQSIQTYKALTWPITSTQIEVKNVFMMRFSLKDVN